MSDWEDEAGEHADGYVLSEGDRPILAAATELLFKILGSGLPDDEQREVVARIGRVLAGLPALFEPLAASVTLTGPRRRFGEHEIYHWWTVEVEDHVVVVKTSGHFFRPSTGGDTFLSFCWAAAPGEETEIRDYLPNLALVDDAASFPNEVRAIELSDGGYSLEVLLDLEPVGGDEEPEDSEQEDEPEGEDEEELELPEARLKQFADLERAAASPMYASPPETCDVCGRDLENARYFVDGVRRDAPEWANMCSECFADVGTRISWGVGQLYARQRDGSWLLVGGFPPEDDEE